MYESILQPVLIYAIEARADTSRKKQKLEITKKLGVEDNY